MAVIPNSIHGTVIVWDNNSASQVTPGPGIPWKQRFAVGDLENQLFVNREITIPLGINGEFFGDLFCSGHVWLPDGRLFVAGGNSRYPHPTTGGPYEGSQFVGIWSPALFGNATHGWDLTITQTKPMNKKRWYPTCTLLSNNTIVVSGGSEMDPHPVPYCPNINDPLRDGAFNTFEVWNIAANDWERDPNTGAPVVYPGPTSGGGGSSVCGTVLGEYPRMHLVSNNELFLCGMFGGGNRLWHDLSYVPPILCQPTAVANWETNPSVAVGCPPLVGTPGWPVYSSVFRNYGSSVLLPNVGNAPGGRDLVMIIAGGPCNPAHQTSQIIDASAASPAWAAPQTMVSPRECPNAVLLTNGEVLVIGGSQTDGFSNPAVNPALQPEVFNKVTGWRAETAQFSSRMYHSTAVLLPSGRVGTAGGDARTVLQTNPVLKADYEVFTPSYLAQMQVRPVFTGTFGASGFQNLAWNTEYVIEYAPLPAGISVSRVVLMRPCSVTHHCDMDQRYIELIPTFSGEYDNAIAVRTPNAPTSGNTPGSVVAPRGWYMAFLVTTQDTPSTARWVRLP